jgi:glycosyltransferase involved in cell wall biosynthesis
VALASRLGVSTQIRWLGWQAKDALPNLYREADALVNPSLYEGMPNVVLEAMASGLPVIASDVPGNRAVVFPEETGLLFPLDDETALGASVTRLIGDPSLAGTLGQGGRSRAERDFSWLAAARSYLELLPSAPAKFSIS